MVAKVVSMTAQPAAVVLMVIEMMRLVAVGLEGFVQVHLRLEALMAGAAIEQAMILPMVVIVVHAVGGVGGGVGARRAVRGGSVVV